MQLLRCAFGNKSGHLQNRAGVVGRTSRRGVPRRAQRACMRACATRRRGAVDQSIVILASSRIRSEPSDFGALVSQWAGSLERWSPKSTPAWRAQGELAQAVLGADPTARAQRLVPTKRVSNLTRTFAPVRPLGEASEQSHRPAAASTSFTAASSCVSCDRPVARHHTRLRPARKRTRTPRGERAAPPLILRAGRHWCQAAPTAAT